MAKNITLMGANYPDVPAVTLPQTGGGTATFGDVDQFAQRGYLTNCDLNDIKTPGIYLINSYTTVQNLPTATQDLWQMVVSASTSGGYVIQEIVSGTTKVHYLRVFNVNWSSW